ncbi:hypothetical protein KC19_1G249600 [Ceratodon purpureus]|uniref:Uncharacterized protein n=1 Tax=Ceratodon purpureus TaxID=3225 RepID=A0A8T0J912_CERPU|nr:hypothetical protein KC19_1G249600 [Ceratodon purpureus]
MSDAPLLRQPCPQREYSWCEAPSPGPVLFRFRFRIITAARLLPVAFSLFSRWDATGPHFALMRQGLLAV